MAKIDPAKLQELKLSDLNSIELRARALSFEQCLVALKIDQAEMSDYDMQWAKLYYNAGAADAIYQAVDKLFGVMSTQKGTEAAAFYLTNRSDFQLTKNTTPDGKTNFNFTMILPEEQQ